jgi:pre-rRNA-processing protein TSR3
MFYEVIIDSGETPNKCTIAPLSYRRDFKLIRVKGEGLLGPLSSAVLLHHQGECLTQLRQTLGPVEGIASIDCIWRRLGTLLRRVHRPMPVLARIPEGFETAYPRTSKLKLDPTGGLATIEAIFTARALLGHWDVTLLSEYYFGRRFVELNAQRFVELGVHQASVEETFPLVPSRPRNSSQRRRDRRDSP